MTMESGQIVSLRTALRYLRHGDDLGKRQRLAVILICMYVLPAVLIAVVVLTWLM